MILVLCTSCERNEAAQVVAIDDSFSADVHEVSIGEFTAFTENTGYQSTGDSIGWGAVFSYEQGIWTVDSLATWRRPEGKPLASNEFPVTQVSYADACAYCEWKKGRIPSADEWDSLLGENTEIGNIWEGIFPLEDRGDDGYVSRPAPVGSFNPNSYGIHDLKGNVWEWTSSKDEKGDHIIKGGSFLCADNYCKGYEAEQFQTTPEDSGLNHLGFRCVYDRD